MRSSAQVVLLALMSLLLSCIHSGEAFVVSPHPTVRLSPRVQSPLRYRKSKLSSGLTSASSDGDASQGSPSMWERLASTFSQRAAIKYSKRSGGPLKDMSFNAITMFRVGIPSIIGGFVATLAFPALSLCLATMMNDAGVFAVLSQDSSQFVQNFLTVSGLLFSILVGQTYYFMYQQQEMVYYSLFDEVTEAKSLLEQVALVCEGRSMYRRVLESIQQYVRYDLKALTSDPAVLLSSRPIDDPLEAIMYLTSVGVPSHVYETVRSLRQARASRLGALQRKLPQVHMVLLWILAMIELVSFPLLGAGTQTIGGYRILTVEGCLFGVMTAGIILTLRVVGELWRPAGGAYNVDNVLNVMVSGLEEELKERINGSKIYSSRVLSPSLPNEENEMRGLRGFDSPTALSSVAAKPKKGPLLKRLFPRRRGSW